VRVDRLFRVFHNNRYPYIDVKVEQEELTELVEAKRAREHEAPHARLPSRGDDVARALRHHPLEVDA